MQKGKLMAIAVIATFKEFNESVKQFFDWFESNHDAMKITLFASTTDIRIFEKYRASGGVEIVLKKDDGYPEGWNNATELFEHWSTSFSHVVFLGEGDAILTVPHMPVLDARTVYYGSTLRIGDDSTSFQLKRSRPIPALFWLFTNGWTPSFLWPVASLEGFKFDRDRKVGADIEIFFQSAKKKLNFVSMPSFLVMMKDGGLSANSVERGRLDYHVISMRYHNIILSKMGHFLRCLRSSFR